MSMLLSTKPCARLLQRKQVKQTVEESTRQRGNVPFVGSQLSTELQRQIRCQKEKKRVLSAGPSPDISNRPVGEDLVSRRMHLKFINKRITSALPTGQDALCDRHVAMQDAKLSRHFCELLGPRLCVDCIKASERREACREHEREPASFLLDREPFNALVCSYLSKQREEDESMVIKSDSEEGQFSESDFIDELNNKQVEELQLQHDVMLPKISRSASGGTVDSGFSSRLSYIRELTRAQSCSYIRNFTPFSPLRREKTHAPRIRRELLDSRKNSRYGSLSRNFSSDQYGFLSTIQKLRNRADFTRNEGGKSRAWTKSPVEPVLMELKFINFTEYTDLGYQPPPKPEQQEPQVTYDEFGFPIMMSQAS